MRVAARMLPSSSLAPTAARRRSFALGRLPLPPSSAAALFSFPLLLRSQHLMIFNASFDQVGQISAAARSFGLCENVRGKPQQLTPLLGSTRIAINGLQNISERACASEAGSFRNMFHHSAANLSRVPAHLLIPRLKICMGPRMRF